MNKILVILTGGTICSQENENGERTADAQNAKYRIISNFTQSTSPYKDADFDFLMPLNILSENMTISTWNTLLDTFRDNDFDDYKGIIILHGTDTLAYTSSLLSLVLTHLNIPVILVSSQLPVSYEEANGNANFRAATELILNGIAPNVYAVYRNSDGEAYLHYGSCLLQCKNHSDDFFSPRSLKIPDCNNAKLDGVPFRTKNNFLRELKELKPCVLSITPYVGINYDSFNLRNISAVVHGTYHTQAVCVERSKKQGSFTNHSILHLAQRCREENVHLFLAPCSENAFSYESTGDALENGILPVNGMTNETAYVKILAGCSMNLKKDELIEITVDGKIDKNEIEDFVGICKELEKISVAVESLQLWAEKMLATGVIDKKEYDRCREAD